MNEESLKTYLETQGELGGFEVVLSEVIVERKEVLPEREEPVIKPPPVIQKNDTQDDLLWKDSTDINSFYEALRKHSIYTKSMRSISFYVPKEVKTNASFLLLFHSPQELTADARNILERLFKKLGLDLSSCAISFFFKCNETAYPREKQVLKDMLYKEIELINPGKIIFFREEPRPEKTEAPAKISDKPTPFAGKPSITLYSLLEMLPGKPGVKDKMNEVLGVCGNIV
jgi:hypothetical protein